MSPLGAHIAAALIDANNASGTELRQPLGGLPLTGAAGLSGALRRAGTGADGLGIASEDVLAAASLSLVKGSAGESWNVSSKTEPSDSVPAGAIHAARAALAAFEVTLITNVSTSRSLQSVGGTLADTSNSSSTKPLPPGSVTLTVLALHSAAQALAASHGCGRGGGGGLCIQTSQQTSCTLGNTTISGNEGVYGGGIYIGSGGGGCISPDNCTQVGLMSRQAVFKRLVTARHLYGRMAVWH